MPTREMVIRLAQALGIPENDKRVDELLDSAGFRSLREAPRFESAEIRELNEVYGEASVGTKSEMKVTIRLLIEAVRARSDTSSQ